MTKLKSWMTPVVRIAAVAALVLSLTPTPASAVMWGGSCNEHKYVLNANADVYSCDLSSETFFTCYYSCQCVTC